MNDTCVTLLTSYLCYVGHALVSLCYVLGVRVQNGVLKFELGCSFVVIYRIILQLLRNNKNASSL